jgi:hypothetical protein
MYECFDMHTVNGVHQSHVAAFAAVTACTLLLLLLLSCGRLRRRTQLQGLRDKFAAAAKCPDYVDIAAQAKAICGKARRGAAQQSQQQQVRVCC